MTRTGVTTGGPPVASQPPPGLLAVITSWWPWRSAAYIASGIVIGLVWMMIAILWIGFGLTAFVLVLGILVFSLLPLLGIGLAAVERARLRLMGYAPMPSPHRSPERSGLWAWLHLRWTEAATWRELAHGGLLSVMAMVDLIVFASLMAVAVSMVGLPLARYLQDTGGISDTIVIISTDAWQTDLATLPWPAIGAISAAALALVVLALWPLTHYARGRAMLANWLLAPPQLDADELMQSRSRIVSTFDSERRRIERDLHDGPQQQLTALLLTLGLARQSAPEGLRDLLSDAQAQAQTALHDLRNVVQGIHPSLLTDRGLIAAIEAMARRLPLDVEVQSDIEGPVSEQAEVMAYFVVSEGLTNVVRHSRSDEAMVEIRTVDGWLVVEVRDNGVGGADPTHGTGLVGITDRVAALGGSLTISSPGGGPTVLRVELPCGS